MVLNNEVSRWVHDGVPCIGLDLLFNVTGKDWCVDVDGHDSWLELATECHSLVTEMDLQEIVAIYQVGVDCGYQELLKE